ncbi:MAG: 23S rRNA (adenine(2030)-N(6))-methyltransferase RlmJ [Rhodospirillales bacterium]|nr:23S rRNA (adenine(2030)-N(6))-methyltransferase RlmJ [Rhodospirillales bacterium]
MNYRHAFHAGNHGDCLKHAVLVWLLRAMQRKPAGFLFLDTHAGIGRYDLESGPASRTGEWRQGIARLLAAAPSALADWLALVRASSPTYPGSPALAAMLARPQDRLALCELHPQDAAALRAAFHRLRHVGVHERDGWEALRALLPAPERRALVLIDPPYEAEEEMAMLAAGMAAARARMPGAVIAAWLPLKHRAPQVALLGDLAQRGIRDLVLAELALRPPLDPARLNGSAMLIAGPPFGWEDGLAPVLAALAGVLAEPDGGWTLRRVADE